MLPVPDGRLGVGATVPIETPGLNMKPVSIIQRSLGLLILCVMSVSVGESKEPADSLDGVPFVSARAWAIAEGQSGKLLWSSQADMPLKAASTTKIMCAWIVLELARNDPRVLEETVTFSQLADDTEKNQIGGRRTEHDIPGI